MLTDRASLLALVPAGISLRPSTSIAVIPHYNRPADQQGRDIVKQQLEAFAAFMKQINA